MFGDFAKSLGQLPDPRFRRVLLLGIGLTLALLIGLTVLVTWLVGWLVPDTVSLPWIGDVSWVSGVASWTAVLLMMVLSVVLMVPVATAFTGIFLDDVADAVEDRYYPGLAQVKVPFFDTVKDTGSSIAVALVVNLVALVLMFFVGPLAPMLFWAVNGFILGRDFFQMAAIRHEGRDGALRLRRKNAGQIWAAGTLLAIPLTVPILNLLMPILGAATFTHMYHRLSGR